MIVKKEYINKIKDFGLNSYEAKLWTALLSRGVSTAGELSDIANVPRSRSYDVLESLERKGFIIMKLGKPIKYIAVSPKEVIERVKIQIKKEADKKQKIIETLKESKILSELQKIHSEGIEMVEPAELTGALKGRNNIMGHLESMINTANKSVYLMTTEDGFKRKCKKLKKSLKKAKERGVDIKIIAPMTKSNKEELNELKSIAEIRHCDKVNARFLLADNSSAITMLLDDKKTHPTYDFGVWMNTPFHSQGMGNLFNTLWSTLKK